MGDQDRVKTFRIIELRVRGGGGPLVDLMVVVSCAYGPTPWELKSDIGLTTAQAYEAWARTKRAEVLTDELPEGAKLHWIGPRRVDRVIIYFPGGYMLPPQKEHFDMLLALRREFKGAVGIALLNYGTPALVPENPFPKQLHQAFAAVQHLLDAGTSPSKLILAGDSAGGNLALQIVGQLLDPHPSLPTPPAVFRRAVAALAVDGIRHERTAVHAQQSSGRAPALHVG